MGSFGKYRPFFLKSVMVLLAGGFLWADEPMGVHSHSMIPAGSVSQTPAADLAAAQTHFGLAFFQEILKENPGRNVLISPFSAATALGMVYNGAHGETQKEMAQTLGLGDMELDEVNRENKALMDSLLGADPKVKFTIANGLWGNDGGHFKFKAEFLNLNQDYYKAEVDLLDFSKNDTPAIINQWVSGNTMGKITKLIDSLGRRDKLVLVNAIYFKGNWTNQFSKNATKPAPFHLADGTSPDRPFMRQTHEYGYFDTEKFQAVWIPYGNGRLNLLVFLPSKGSGIADFCAALTPDNWDQWMGQWGPRKVILSLPKFKVEFKQDLIPSLKALGMKDAFGREADFRNIALNGERLFISKALQKTYMLVDEEGTEAAAATGIVARANVMHMEPPPVVMTVDRPFFIALVDKQTKTILFAGAIADPQNP